MPSEPNEDEALHSPFSDVDLVFAEEAGGATGEDFENAADALQSPFQRAFEFDVDVELEASADYDDALETQEFEEELLEGEMPEGSVLGGLFSAGENESDEGPFVEPRNETRVEEFDEKWEQEGGDKFFVSDVETVDEVDEFDDLENEDFLDEFDEEDNGDIEAETAYVERAPQ